MYVNRMKHVMQIERCKVVSRGDDDEKKKK